MRLEKFVALAGVASRRASKDIIREGRVIVDGEIVTETGHAINEKQADVRVDGKRVRISTDHRYILLNKPTDTITTAKDTRGRNTVFALLPPMPQRLAPVGRLDADTSGVLLLTNDGDLAFRLTHPRYGVDKTYQATVRGSVTDEAVASLREGVFIEGGKTAPARVTVLHRGAAESRLSIVIHEGRKRQVRLMCLAVGLPVKKLRRTQFGPLGIGSMPAGTFRDLSVREVRQLRRLVGLEPGGEDSQPNRGGNAWSTSRSTANREDTPDGPPTTASGTGATRSSSGSRSGTIRTKAGSTPATGRNRSSAPKRAASTEANPGSSRRFPRRAPEAEGSRRTNTSGRSSNSRTRRPG
ncbi:rRNA pseudouridine synthase [Candidatus Poribacteria bacterium]|nr:rRNA pseudouridine synthase [Candidatus Poribacteria bacterium]